MKDDNERILELIQQRLAIGEERYGHGLRKNDDTTQWGTKTDSWTEMGLEEALDLTIYLSAQLLRILDKEAEREKIDKLRVEHVLKQAQRIKELEAKLEKTMGGYPQEFLDDYFDFDSNPTADTQDDETIALAYAAWLANKKNKDDYPLL